MCDAVAFSAAAVFVSMQTGNTIFLALGAARLPYGESDLWLRALVSLGSFWLGCILFSKLSYLGPLRKSVLSFSYFVQAVAIIISAALAQSNVAKSFALTQLGSSEATQKVYGDRSNELILLPLAFLAFQSGGQIVMTRILKINEVPINVLTSLYCDFLSDPNILAYQNVKRNRRLVAIVSYIGGAIGCGWLQRSRGGMSSALWISGGLKLLISIAWIFWKPQVDLEMNFGPEKVV